jgi:hypothetical protein
MMPVKETKTLYCTKCGSAIPDGEQCKQCDGRNRIALAPASRVRTEQIPGTIGSQLTKVQTDGLAFGARNMVVKSAVIQSFNLGSSSSGKVTLAGLGRGFGPWAVFGAVGSINQTSVNSYRTDIQIKLEDESGQKAFLNYSLPFAITLAIEPGESVRIYFVKGGLQKPTAPGDFKVDSWTAFAAENIDTGQLIPIAGLPTLASPKKGLLAIAVIGVLFTFLLMAAQADAGSVIFSSVITLPFIVAAALRARKYKLALEDATRGAAGAAV